MKLRIIESGWANFTGDFGGVPFEAGVSLREVTQVEAFRLSNAIRIETLEGLNPSSSQQALDALTIPMGASETQVTKEVVAEKTTIAARSRAELEALADSKGIEGLREIGRALGVSSKSINGLIDLIINAQGGEPTSTGLQPQALYGSSKHLSVYEIDGNRIALGTIVRSAFEDYEREGKTVADWNALPAEIREQLIEVALASIRS